MFLHNIDIVCLWEWVESMVANQRIEVFVNGGPNGKKMVLHYMVYYIIKTTL